MAPFAVGVIHVEGVAPACLDCLVSECGRPVQGLEHAGTGTIGDAALRQPKAGDCRACTLAEHHRALPKRSNIRKLGYASFTIAGILVG